MIAIWWGGIIRILGARLELGIPAWVFLLGCHIVYMYYSLERSADSYNFGSKSLEVICMP